MVILSGEGTHRDSAWMLFESEGIARDRITFVGHLPRQLYLKNYHEIDIGLDTLPYNGHSTSLDSIWMGVPVVTQVGSTVVGRAGLCQLMNLGMPELIAETSDQFVSIASELARDLPKLSELRSTLRGRMKISPLMDAARFTQNIETAYAKMWRDWCSDSRSR
jgi:predicted O-linked N-acetylglucosamine transferase (SPINDLY family)